MIDDLRELLSVHCESRRIVLGSELGWGIHGLVHAVRNSNVPCQIALKQFRHVAHFRREWAAYRRLEEENVIAVRGCNVPVLLGAGEDTLVLALSIVQPPFALDFAASQLDRPPDFPDEVWAEREQKHREEFGPDWPEVRLVLAELQGFGLHMLDPTPRNIRLR